jgi:anti-sigma B factor antagonist
MPINVRVDGDVVILSNFARLLDDPRHFDAQHDVRDCLEEGHRSFVLDLTGLRDPGSSALGLLTTLTRLIRNRDGDAVVANLSPAAEKYFEDMRMDTYWEIFASTDEALAYFRR